MTLLASLRAFIQQQSFEPTYWIAYSGGMDSHVLLALCEQLRHDLPLKLQAIHVNHQLNPHADAWALHCAQVCDTYHIPYHEFKLQLDVARGESLEELAREERYAIFAKCLNPGDILLTAHHQDDQAETVMLQLLRGAGLKGLAAMPAKKSFAQGAHTRPLLQFTRNELEVFAQQQQLNWITDDSNQNTKFKRNFLRHEILPNLISQWPSASMTLARSAQHCAEAQALLEEFGQEIYHSVAGSVSNTLSVSKLLTLSEQKQRLVLRTWMQQHNVLPPNANKLNSILNNVLTANWDRSPCVEWGDTVLRRYRDDLFLLPPLMSHNVTQQYDWKVQHALTLPNIGTLRMKKLPGLGLSHAIQRVQVRFRQGGESIALPKRGRKTLKNLFNEWNVLPWQRDRIPLLFVEEELAAVVGYAVAANFLDEENAQQIYLDEQL